MTGELPANEFPLSLFRVRDRWCNEDLHANPPHPTGPTTPTPTTTVEAGSTALEQHGPRHRAAV